MVLYRPYANIFNKMDTKNYTHKLCLLHTNNNENLFSVMYSCFDSIANFLHHNVLNAFNVSFYIFYSQLLCMLS